VIRLEGWAEPVVLSSGGRVVTPEGEPFLYGKKATGYRNGSFVVWGW
jgi:hypothetical protein